MKLVYALLLIVSSLSTLTVGFVARACRVRIQCISVVHIYGFIHYVVRIFLFKLVGGKL
jgi:hypothetical protein